MPSAANDAEGPGRLRPRGLKSDATVVVGFSPPGGQAGSTLAD